MIAEALDSQRRSEKRRWFVLSALLILLLCSFIFDIATGPSLLDLGDVTDALLNKLGAPVEVARTTEVIVTNLRLPIALMAIIVTL